MSKFLSVEHNNLAHKSAHRKGVSTMKRLTQGLAKVLFAVTVLVPQAVFAQGGLGTSTLPLPEALPSQTSFLDLLTFIINFFLGLVGTVAILMLIYGGFLYLTSAGGENIKKAKNTIMYAIIGIVVILLSYAIVNTVTSTLAGR
ncbi:MAG: hypothetical protein A2V81_02985 [Candidatus Abawacabacteria bacterium RBG_16_42_10]|uniref:Uncharacterized protein n=1 Tax=Candidatus Abawacabacteria bacterium RBG_16_42_10 TaxID=1817814 RepID=A0A1F4XKE6_9BACT|nr:MAG: hypothetical protein A2V81_02985 [Candidatus Abawacabacteria bacterium RBG_16_42_10]